MKEQWLIELENKIDEYFKNTSDEQILKDLKKSDPKGVYEKHGISFLSPEDLGLEEVKKQTLDVIELINKLETKIIIAQQTKEIVEDRIDRLYDWLELLYIDLIDIRNKDKVTSGYHTVNEENKEITFILPKESE